jgi:hypothetical protein
MCYYYIEIHQKVWLDYERNWKKKKEKKNSTIIFVLSVHLSAWRKSALKGRIIVRFYTRVQLLKYVEKIKACFKIIKKESTSRKDIFMTTLITNISLYAFCNNR